MVSISAAEGSTGKVASLFSYLAVIDSFSAESTKILLYHVFPFSDKEMKFI